MLLFAQTTTLLDLLEKYVRGMEYSYLRMDGTTPISKRMAMIDQFNNDDDVFLFLLTTKVNLSALACQREKGTEDPHLKAYYAPCFRSVVSVLISSGQIASSCMNRIGTQATTSKHVNAHGGSDRNETLSCTGSSPVERSRRRSTTDRSTNSF